VNYAPLALFVEVDHGAFAVADVVLFTRSYIRPMMIDDIGFGYLLVVGMVAIFLGGLVWWMLNGQSRR
jgi:hypothetical protein